MDYWFNDWSFHGQFRSTQEFRAAVETVMQIRQEIQRFGGQLHCRREFMDAQVAADTTMRQAIKQLSRDKQQAWIQWLTKHGPFWSGDRQHGDDGRLELEDKQVVTNSAIGEVAYRNLNGLKAELITIDPSDWLRQPIRVRWVRGSPAERETDVTNHWTHASVLTSLKAAPSTYDSWATLEECVRRKCNLLTFAEKTFQPLRSHPFVRGAAEGIESRLNILNDFHGCFDDNGHRSAEGDQLHSDYFVGSKAYFTDSSESEKNDFKSKLTFDHPGRSGERLFCPWHGKVNTKQIRIHYYDKKISKHTPLYVVYVGPKITKK